MDNDTLDTIIIGGPTYITLDVTVTGRSAHAGMEPEKGINAIQAAARAIAALRIGRLDHETTANVGIIEGGRFLLVREGSVPARVDRRTHFEGVLSWEMSPRWSGRR